MAQEKLTGRSTTVNALSSSDVFHAVDVSDISQDPAGSSFKYTVGDLQTFMQNNLTFANIYNGNGSYNSNRTITTLAYTTTWEGADGTEVVHTYKNTTLNGGVRLKLQDSVGNAVGLNYQSSIPVFNVYTGNCDIRLAAGGANKAFIATNGIDRITVLSNGFVGIGTSSPSSMLFIEETNNTFNHTINLKNNSGGNQAATDFFAANDTGANVSFGVLGSNNTSFPQYGSGSDGFFRFNANDVNFTNVNASSKFKYYIDASGANGSAVVTMTSNSIGINGVTSPTSNLHVKTSLGGSGLAVYTNGGSPVLYTNDSGYVGIGTSSPGIKLQVEDSGNAFKESIFAYNTNVGISSAVSIGVYNGSAGLSMGVLGSGNTTHVAYGSANWGFMNVGAANGINFVGSSPKYRFYNGLATGTASLIIDSGTKISMPLLQVGNGGLASFDLYKDTAANILANGDYVIGMKV